MTYDVLKEFHDEEFKVRNADGEKVPLHRDQGETFIPAEYNYPANKVATLVSGGTLKLIVPSPPDAAEEPKAKAKKK